MADDLAHEPISGMYVQMVGDAHLGNFGFFATPERDEVFDTDDFDETLPGPWEWDVRRLAVSVQLLAEANGCPPAEASGIVARTGRTYRQHLERFAAASYLATWYAHLDRGTVRASLGPAAQRQLRRGVEAARRRKPSRGNPEVELDRGGRPRLRVARPWLHPYADPSEVATMRRALEQYRRRLSPEHATLLDRYRLQDVAEKVVGVGSVGTRCGVALFVGDDDPRETLFLQIKEAVRAAGEPFLGRSVFPNHAERVVVGQRLVQEASDVLLGWSAAGGRSFYVRQLHDMKISSDLSALRPRDLKGLAELSGYSLARAHARTGDPARIAGYLGSSAAFDRAIARFAATYAVQVRADHAALVRAIRTGRIEAAAGEPPRP